MAMSDPLLPEKLVYLALKDVFTGNEIQPSITKKIRKKVRKRIEKFQEDVEIRTLIQDYSLERVTKVAVVLLEEKIFGSDSRAKARFPDIFEVSPGQDNKPTNSVPKIATGDGAAVQSKRIYSREELLRIGAMAKANNEEEERIKAKLPVYIPKVTTSTLEVLNDVQGRALGTIEINPLTTPAVIESPQQPYVWPRIAMESLDSVCLPLWDQHRILVTVQYALEKACFAFAQKFLGGVLQREGWDCAEAVELNRWPKVLLTYQEECHLNDSNNLDKPLPVLLNSITQLRHDAVHRARLSSRKTLQHLTDAVILARLLQDDICAEIIFSIWKKAQDAIEQLVRDKQALETKLATIREEFAVKRAELERQEAALLETARREHREPMVSVSGSLDQLSDDFGSTHVLHALWKYGSDPALPDDERSVSRGTTELKAEGDSEADIVEGSDKGVAVSDQLPTPPILVPTTDGGIIELAFAGDTNEDDEGRAEDSSKVEPSSTQPYIDLTGDETEPKHPSENPPLNLQGVASPTMIAVEEIEHTPKIATKSVLTDPYLGGERDEEILCEPNTSHTSTEEQITDDDADDGPWECAGRWEPSSPELISVGTGHADFDIRTEQRAAIKGNRGPLTGSGGIQPLDYDPRSRLLTIADERGGVTIVRVQDDIDPAA